MSAAATGPVLCGNNPLTLPPPNPLLQQLPPRAARRLSPPPACLLVRAIPQEADPGPCRQRRITWSCRSSFRKKRGFFKIRYNLRFELTQFQTHKKATRPQGVGFVPLCHVSRAYVVVFLCVVKAVNTNTRCTTAAAAAISNGAMAHYFAFALRNRPDSRQRRQLCVTVTL